MQEHVAYWKDLADRRIAVIFGPVLDPDGDTAYRLLKRMMKLLFEA